MFKHEDYIYGTPLGVGTHTHLTPEEQSYLVDWVNDRPKTKAYIKMRNSSLSPCLKWFVDFIDNYPFEYNDLNHGWVSRDNIHKWLGPGWRRSEHIQ